MAKPSRSLDWDIIQLWIITFVNRWVKSGKTNEKSHGQGFVIEFLKAFGIDWLAAPDSGMETKVFDGYSDYIWFGRIIIEMKSKGADPGFHQAESQIKRYTQDLSDDQKPILWMACDFENIRLWNRHTDQVWDFKTAKLKKYRKHFAPMLEGTTDACIHRDKEGVNRLAAEKMARLHDELKKHNYSDQDLEIYLARLLFCLFANDTDIFQDDSFQRYIEASSESGSDLDARLGQLFQDLNEPVGKRVPNPFLSEQIDPAHFRYINGGLFDKPIRRAKFDKKMRQELLECLDFDWGQIRPAIFGSMFQGVMDKDQRREIGAHYTSEENILKLINPLFMDDLRKEFDSIKKQPKTKKSLSLVAFQNKLAKLKFLDPACGCGNFLIVAYRELRRLELEVVKTMLYGEEGKSKLGKMLATPIEGNLKVNVDQFYGIEIEEWPCQIARTGMWLMDHLVNLEATTIFERYEYRLPLKQSATIVHANAHRVDWETIVPNNEMSYILGNPPFIGSKMMSERQRDDLVSQFVDNKGNQTKNAGVLDYVAAWYYKASKYLQRTPIRAAFVSTNSLTQGEQVAALWKPLHDMFGIHIDFAYRTFKWDNEARGKAAVHCVIVGFSTVGSSQKVIFEGECNTVAKNINPYLVDAPDVFIESRATPICDVPQIGIGNKPIDDGNYLFTDEEKKEFLKIEPQAKKWFRPWIGSHEFINGYTRHCLWLGDCPPSELKQMPETMKRVDAVRQFRLKSKSVPTQKLADTPRRFHVENMPEVNYVVVPETSSERRAYVPIGFLSPKVLCSNAVKIIPNATLYHFGILTSSVHMAWTRAVCGRLEMRYRYSKDIVYNNFPWPDATDKQKTEIEKLAQGILDVRAIFPKSSLADLYDPLTMPPELLKAHNALDRAVMKLYGFGKDKTEPKFVAELMERYLILANKGIKTK